MEALNGIFPKTLKDQTAFGIHRHFVYSKRMQNVLSGLILLAGNMLEKNNYSCVGLSM